MKERLFKAWFYRKLGQKSVECRLCSHFCRIASGQTGICGARKNFEGELFSCVYGHPAALHVDPIEKKPLYHFLPGTASFSIGTLGCNFRCKNCHNYDITQVKPVLTEAKPVLPSEVVEGAVRSGCASIAYTYNEPTIFTEYALEIMKIARRERLKNVWVSNGFMSSECLEKILPLLDAINVDLKSMDEVFYKNVCHAKLSPILENLKTIKKSKAHLEVTTLVVPTLSDAPKMLAQIAQFIVSELGAETPWHISRFAPEISWRLKDLPFTTNSSLKAAYEAGRAAGLKHVYAGGLDENTYCPSCGELCVRRLYYEIERLDRSGRCQKCGADLDILP